MNGVNVAVEVKGCNLAFDKAAVAKGAKVTCEQCADLIAESEVKSELDLGHSFLYKLKHPKLGRIILVNSSVGDSGYVYACNQTLQKLAWFAAGCFVSVDAIYSAILSLMPRQPIEIAVLIGVGTAVVVGGVAYALHRLRSRD